MFREQLDVDGDYSVLYDFDGSTIQILLVISMKQYFVNARAAGLFRMLCH